ncbi:hypothetical protein RKD20_002290 [Streptomyces sp. SLBN-8D4]|jgi:hypothetical protein
MMNLRLANPGLHTVPVAAEVQAFDAKVRPRVTRRVLRSSGFGPSPLQ